MYITISVPIYKQVKCEANEKKIQGASDGKCQTVFGFSASCRVGGASVET